MTYSIGVKCVTALTAGYLAAGTAVTGRIFYLQDKANRLDQKKEEECTPILGRCEFLGREYTHICSTSFHRRMNMDCRSNGAICSSCIALEGRIKETDKQAERLSQVNPFWPKALIDKFKERS